MKRLDLLAADADDEDLSASVVGGNAVLGVGSLATMLGPEEAAALAGWLLHYLFEESGIDRRDALRLLEQRFEMES